MERTIVLGTRWERPAVLASNAGHGDQGGKPSPFGLKMILNSAERGGVLPHRDTELPSWAGRLTSMSAFAFRAPQRKGAAYPAVQGARAAMIAAQRLCGGRRAAGPGRWSIDPVGTSALGVSGTWFGDVLAEPG
jgi:hypothetical protein